MSLDDQHASLRGAVATGGGSVRFARLRRGAAVVLVALGATLGFDGQAASTAAIPSASVTADGLPLESPPPTFEPPSPPPADRTPTPDLTPTPEATPAEQPAPASSTPTPTPEATPAEQPAPASPTPTPESHSAPAEVQEPVAAELVALATVDPFGNLDSLAAGSGTVTASGWALDPDTTSPIIVQMYLDYAANTMTWANLPRPDVDAAFGLGPNHGFSMSLNVTPGTHTVCVYAINTGPGTTTPLGCRTITVGHDCSVLKCVALTFDDGPGPYTSRLLNVLEATAAEATFFLVGERIAGYPTVVRRMRSLGMEVANHSWNHADLTTLSTTEITSQLSRTSATIESTLGNRPTLMRPPYGARNATVDSVARQQGLAVILWSLDSLDWRYLDPVRTRSVVANGSVDGTIVLMHDIHSTTVDAVPGIISELRARGFTLVTVSEILGSPVPGVVYSHG